MKRLLRWMGIALGGLAGLAILAYAVVYVLSERILRRTYEVPAVAISIPTDPAAVVEGKRLATIHGCFGGCHGRQVEGAVMFDEPMIGRVVAPNLTAAVRKYSDSELVGIIRHGVRPGGRSMMVMPSEEFVLLTDEDLARIIAFLKSMPAVDGPAPSLSLGPLGGSALSAVSSNRWLNSSRKLSHHPMRRARRLYTGGISRGPSAPSATGQACAVLLILISRSPSLQLVAAYSPESFAQLMRAGVALGGRNLKTMSPWAQQHLSHLKDSEIAALYSYLHTMP